MAWDKVSAPAWSAPSCDSKPNFEALTKTLNWGRCIVSILPDWMNCSRSKVKWSVRAQVWRKGLHCRPALPVPTTRRRWPMVLFLRWCRHRLKRWMWLPFLLVYPLHRRQSRHLLNPHPRCPLLRFNWRTIAGTHRSSSLLGLSYLRLSWDLPSSQPLFLPRVTTNHLMMIPVIRKPWKKNGYFFRLTSKAVFFSIKKR